jgi:tRNA nucleotidyltransferase (CCA-adding enzyme)
MFLARPDARLFKRGGVRGKVRKPLRDRVYVVRFDHRPLSEDTLWGELKKSTRQVVKHVEKHGFSIARAIAASDDVGRSAIILLPETDVLSEMEERVGPGVELAAEVKRFISMNRDRIELAWVGDDGRIHLLQRRKYTELARLLERLIEREIAEIGASREVSAGIRKTGTLIRTAGKLNRAADEDGWLEKGIDEIVSDTIGTDSGR